MSLPFAINGLGRIGRALLRISAERESLELKAVNDLAPAGELAHLIRRDTLHGPASFEIGATPGSLEVAGRSVPVFGEAEADDIPWQGTSAQVVVDATGKCKSRECATSHLGGEVGHVIVSANAEGLDLTICCGVNEGDFVFDQHRLLSGASCTTNCLAPVLHLLDQTFGVRKALFNTVHSYNNDQHLLEFAHPDPRRARAAALNMIPTSTSAVAALGRVLPALADRVDGFAVRVPTPNVSLVDLVFELENDTSVEKINETFRSAEAGALSGVIATTDEQLVSSDFLGDPHSAVVDLPLTARVGGSRGASLFRLVAWYDNEWGHASRLADLLELVARHG